MFEGNDLPEVALPLIESDQVVVVLVVSQAEADIPEHPEAELLFEGTDHKGFHDLQQPGIVVVVEVDFPPFGVGFDKSQGACGRDEIVAVELFRATVSPDHLIDEGGRGFPGGKAREFQPAMIPEPEGIGEGDARHTGAEPSGIDTQDEAAGLVIGVIFPVKEGRDPESFRIFPVGIHDPEAFRDGFFEGEGLVKGDNYFLPGSSSGLYRVILAAKPPPGIRVRVSFFDAGRGMISRL